MSTTSGTPFELDERGARLQSAVAYAYTLTGWIGRGGMGDVYLATHKELGGRWAIKVLADNLATDASLVERFIREARIEAGLQHPNIVKVFDIGQKDEFKFFVMGYVEGEDLDTRMKRTGAMPYREVLGLAQQVVSALECAHDNGITHRDLKPSNIRIDRYGTVIVMDFGIARVKDPSVQGKTVVGESLGTPAYMSPEQAQGRPVDTRSDLYSFGVVLYAMLAGSNPFDGPNPFAVIANHLTVHPKPLKEISSEIPEALSDIVEKLLSKEADARYQHAVDVRSDLANLGVGADIRTPRSTAPILPTHLAALGPLDSVVNRIPDAEIGRPLTDAEQRILNLIDGTRSIQMILAQSGLKEEEAAQTLSSLQDAGALYMEIPLMPEDGQGSTILRPPPADATRIETAPPSADRTIPTPKPSPRPVPKVQPARPAAPKVVPRQPVAPPPQSRKWILAVVAVVVLAAAGVGVWWNMGPKVEPATVQVDASPFAKVTIRSDSGRAFPEFETPFAIQLDPGSYTFEFVNGDRRESLKKAITSMPDSVRFDFWNPEDTRGIVEKYR